MTPSTIDLHEHGLVSGRFQPFHNDHLSYALESLELSRFVTVGVTQPDISHLISTGPSHRADRHSNPLSFDERAVLIEESLIQEGISRSRFEVIEFPIESLSKIERLLPSHVVAFVSMVESWSVAKVDRLEKAGYTVEKLHIRHSKQVEGTKIRNAIRAGEPWDHLVPPSVYERLVAWGIQERLAK